MTILTRYIVRETSKYIGSILLVIATIYTVADFVNKADEFLEADLPFLKMMLCFAAQMPLEQFIPASVLLSILVVFGLMTKSNEILALKSSGISHWELLRPVLGIGTAISLILFIASELFFPPLRAEANRIWINEVEQDRIVQRQKNIWIKEGPFIYHFRHFDPIKLKLFDIAINEFDDSFRMVRRLNAEEGVFIEDRWHLKGVMEQLLDPETGSFSVQLYENIAIESDVRPEDLKSVARGAEEMGFLELLEYVNKVEAEGYDATSYRTDFHAKLAFPIMGLMLCLLGSGIALGREGPIHLPLMVISGIGVAFCYWVIRSFCISLAYGGMLNPFVAAWFPNILFAVSGLYLLLRRN